MENANLRFTRYKKSDDRNQLSFMPMCLEDMIADDAEVRALELIVEVTDINITARSCYDHIGFNEYKRVSVRWGKIKGFKERAFMKYTNKNYT